MTELAKWDSFCVIMGSAAGALIGLQFVVMTLISERQRRPAPETGAVFATPTIIHFGAVLLLCALLRAPWQDVRVVTALCGLAGFTGVVYALIITRRIRKQNAYRPVFEDWLFHVLLPLFAYGLLAASPFAAPAHIHEALFGVGAATLILLFTGIHNSWDSVTYHVLVKPTDKKSTDSAPSTDH